MAAVMDRLASTLGGSPRDSWLARLAGGAAAMSVAPLRYAITRSTVPETVTCSDCTSGSCCCKANSAFCCQLSGGSNTGCPSGSVIQGFWKCTQYCGNGLCSGGVRFYMDCVTTTSCTGHCAVDSCAKRRTCHYSSGYVQCNDAYVGNKVVCRLVSCKSPSTIPCTGCTGSGTTDDTTCQDDANCLGGASCLSGAC